MPKYIVETLETIQHYYEVEASSMEEAEDIYKHANPKTSTSLQEDIESILKENR
jgi:hypothetical protein